MGVGILRGFGVEGLLVRGICGQPKPYLQRVGAFGRPFWPGLGMCMRILKPDRPLRLVMGADLR